MPGAIDTARVWIPQVWAITFQQIDSCRNRFTFGFIESSPPIAEFVCVFNVPFHHQLFRAWHILSMAYCISFSWVNTEFKNFLPQGPTCAPASLPVEHPVKSRAMHAKEGGGFFHGTAVAFDQLAGVLDLLLGEGGRWTADPLRCHPHRASCRRRSFQAYARTRAKGNLATCLSALIRDDSSSIGSGSSDDPGLARACAGCHDPSLCCSGCRDDATQSGQGSRLRRWGSAV